MATNFQSMILPTLSVTNLPKPSGKDLTWLICCWQASKVTNLDFFGLIILDQLFKYEKQLMDMQSIWLAAY